MATVAMLKNVNTPSYNCVIVTDPGFESAAWMRL